MELVWINSETRLFWHRSEQDPAWLQHVEVEKFWWSDPSKTRLVLRGMLPFAKQLLKIADGDGLELLWSTCNLNDYYAEDVIMRFSNCIVRRRWIPRIAITDPGLSSPITVYVSLECEMGIDV
jgi:hypothetical protein